MNKNLFRLGASLILFNAIYSLYLFKNILNVLDLQSTGMILNFVGDIVFFLLLVATGIGLWKLKKWALVTLWVVVVFTFISSVFNIFILNSRGMIGSYGNNMFTGIFLSSWSSIIISILSSVFTYLIIAIFISLEFKQSKISQ